MRRALLFFVVPTVLLVLMVLPFALYWSSLPGPMAIHWGVDGAANGSAPPLVLVLLLAGLYFVIAVSIQRVVNAAPWEAPSFVAGLLAIGALLAAVSWMSVLANRDVASWQNAASVGFPQVAILIVVTCLGGTAGWFLGRTDAARADRGAGEAPRLSVADPASAVWSGRGVGRLVTAIGVVVIVLGVVQWGLTGLSLVLIGVIVLMFAAVRVTVARGGVVVSLGWWGFPLWKVSLDTVEHAEAEDVKVLAYGGWGYRIRPGVRATVVRSGEGLRLVRSNGADLVYTVDDAARGAGLINALIGSRR